MRTPTIHLVAIVMTLASFCAAPVFAAEPVGSVTAIEGRAEALHAGTEGWVDLATGDAILLGDQLRTAPDSKLKLTFRDDSLLTLAASSSLTVTEQVAGAAPVSRFSLLLGTLRAVVTDRYGQPGARFEVETPTAVAGVHGTGFIATYDGTADQSVFVGLFDQTRVRSRDGKSGQEVRLGPGETTTVRRGSLPLRPKHMPETTLRGLNAATTILPGVSGPHRPGAPGAQGEGKAGPKAAGVTAPPQSPVDQPVELLKRGQHRPPPPPPPVPPGR